MKPEVVLLDLDGKPIFNSAGEPFPFNFNTTFHEWRHEPPFDFDIDLTPTKWRFVSCNDWVFPDHVIVYKE